MTTVNAGVEKWRKISDRIDARLAELLPSETETPGPLHAAMRYAALSPGKRVRPILCLAFATACGKDDRVALDAACAIEMVHAFSLIHDDLPAIDNDDLRRGRPTCHKQFTEAIAILAGDALFALSGEIMLSTGNVAACQTLAAAVKRLVQGEMLDVLSEGKEIDPETLRFIHINKTGALISASCAIGALLSDAPAELVAKANEFGEDIGLAFQIADDILNVEGDPSQTGKSVGSDAERKKATYPALYGLDDAKAKARELAAQAEGCLMDFPGDVEPLRALARFSIERLH